MKFMVCRVDAVEHKIKSSELFPVIVEYPSDTPYEKIVEETLQKKWPGYSPRDKSYYIVPMLDAAVVTFRPRQQYDILVTPIQRWD